MAVDVRIKAEGFLCRQELDLQVVLKNCTLHFGSYNPFFVLEEDPFSEAGILYNPTRMGRGIYFDGKKMNQGEVLMSMNIPTTPHEIDDMFAVVTEIKNQYRNISITCENRDISYEEFLGQRDGYIEYSSKSLRGLCETKEYEAAILTLAAFPYTLTPDEMEFFATEGELSDFEELIHQKQTIDANYACPKIMKKDGTDEIVAFYTYTEDSPTITPVECGAFMSLEHVKISYGMVRFYIDSIKKVLPGYYDYNNFIDVMLKRGATYFDGDHILVPGFSLPQLVEIARELESMPTPDYSNLI